MGRFSRVVAVAATAVLSTVALPPGAASAATSNDCRQSTSTRIVTGGLFGNTTDRLWVDSPTTTRTVVCFQFRSLSLGGLTVIVNVASGATPPSVTVDDDPLLCPNVIVTLVDPVSLQLAAGLASSSVCISLAGSTLSLQFAQGNLGPGNVLPTLEIWRDGGQNFGWIDVAACPAEWITAVAFGGPTTCLTANDQIYP